MTPDIENLPELVAGIPADMQRVFHRIFRIDITRGELHPPRQMLPWIESQFGNADCVKIQSITKVTNKITGESSIFNPLRSLRPRQFQHADETGTQTSVADLFSAPLENTPEEAFGRVRGKHCITAANIAKADQYHGIIVFNNPDPMDFGFAEVADYLETARRWMQAAHDYDNDARYGLLLWNCTHRAGASIRHGHAQLLMGSGRHYGKVEHLKYAAECYRQANTSDYFSDLYHIHEALGLGWQKGRIRTMAYIAALKQHEVILLGDRLNDEMKSGIYRVLSCYREKLKIKAFNLALIFPPLDEVRGWEGFPLIARSIDRGDTTDMSSDISAMELYGASVVASDPFHTAAVLRRDSGDIN